MFYDIGFAIFSLVYLPTLIFKGKLHVDFGERFGVYAKEKRARLAAAKDVIWVQAVSVGEVALCKTLMPLLKKRFPASTIVFSTITKTGNDLAKKLFGNDAIIVYFPLDFSMTVKKAIGIIRPKAYVMIETEIWPNVLKELSRRAVPAVLINGRISDRSFGKYREVRTFLKKTLGRIRSYSMQSPQDAERIIAIGAPKDRVTVTGNMKCDIQAASLARSSKDILAALGLKEADALIVAGSTHPGEEGTIIEAYKRLREGFPEVRLLVAPRHIDRAAEVEKLVSSRGLAPVRVSALSGRPEALGARQVLVLDTIGRLAEIYSVAALVFIGGSLVEHGGQNPIEPAMFEKPIVFGPHMFNFKAITAALLEKGGAVQVGEKSELLERMVYLLGNPAERVKFGNNAKLVVMENRGASERNVKEIAKTLIGAKS
jgi:3-deoxy-D-manno-octulosonic-acid transferase